jgi:NitT/TauT family transport system permease protein
MALGLQTLPSVCWIPLALLWFGQTESAMLFVVVMGTVWSVIIATDTGAPVERFLHNRWGTGLR